MADNGTLNIPEAIHQAIQHHQAGQFQQAEDIYRRVLAADPSSTDANHLLGLILHEAGNNDAAVQFITKALYANPEFSMAHYNLGVIHYEQGRMIDATACFRKAISIKPEYIEAYNYLGLIHNSQGQPNKALACYIKALSIKPDDAGACMGFSFLVKGKTFHQEEHVSLSHLRDILIACFHRNDIEHDDLSTASVSILLKQNVVNAINCYLEDNAPGENNHGIFDDKYLYGLLNDQLFLLLLRKTVIGHELVEKFLTKVRKTLMILVTSSGVNQIRALKSIEYFLYSLAHQCFHNEYVYYQSQSEQESIGKLVSLLENAVSPECDESRFYTALLGCYIPLSSFAFIDIHADNFSSSSAFQDLITVQVKNPLKEKEIIPWIPRLSEIRDDVSTKVREQYEENPYPRWISIYKNKPAYLNDDIQRVIYPNTLHGAPLTDKPVVLIAGSGTGRHAICRAQQLVGSSVLAVDLSLASLAYAKRKADEYDIENIDFLQADILELHQLNRKFDVIECSGVLHHTGDPVKGWKILVDLLRPKGFMKIGLYSEHARHAVISAHSFIENHGYKPTVEDIRECRKCIFELPGESDVKEITKSRDFYSTSHVRDLVFHVQEHRFTIPEISSILDDLNLKMLGFQIGNDIKMDYLSSYPDDTNAISLSNWNQYEKENPDTFVGMYQFWVEKVS